MATELRNWLQRVDGRFMGSPVDVPPHEAILWALRTTAGEVVYCDEQIRRLSEDEIFERPQKDTWSLAPSYDGDNGENETWQEVDEPEVISRWVQLRKDAVDRMAKYAKMALDVGIEERQIQLAENQAKQLVAVITAVLVDLGHDLNDIRTKEIVRRRLLEGATVNSTAVEIGESA